MVLEGEEYNNKKNRLSTTPQVLILVSRGDGFRSFVIFYVIFFIVCERGLFLTGGCGVLGGAVRMVVHATFFGPSPFRDTCRLRVDRCLISPSPNVWGMLLWKAVQHTIVW